MIRFLVRSASVVVRMAITDLYSRLSRSSVFARAKLILPAAQTVLEIEVNLAVE